MDKPLHAQLLTHQHYRCLGSRRARGWSTAKGLVLITCCCAGTAAGYCGCPARVRPRCVMHCLTPRNSPCLACRVLEENFTIYLKMNFNFRKQVRRGATSSKRALSVSTDMCRGLCCRNRNQSHTLIAHLGPCISPADGPRLLVPRCYAILAGSPNRPVALCLPRRSPPTCRQTATETVVILM